METSRSLKRSFCRLFGEDSSFLCVAKGRTYMTTYLPNYAHFKSKEEMDHAAKQHVSANWNELNDTERAVLDLLRRYSVKHGAAHLKHETIAKGVNKSVSTIRRAIVKLERLQIIERVPFIRKVLSGLGANVYAILPFESINEQTEMNSPNDSSDLSESKTELEKLENEPLFLKSSSSSNTEDTVKRGLRDKMPAYIYDLMSPYLDETELYKAYGRLLRAKASVDRTIAFESNEGLFRDAILSVFHTYKRGKVRSLLAVLYTAIQDTSAQIYRSKYYTIPNWIESNDEQNEKPPLFQFRNSDGQIEYA